MTVCATDADAITKNRVFQTVSDVNLYEMPDTASAVTASLPSGTPVIIREDAKDGWCMVSYREEMGYMQIAFLGIVGSPGVPAASNEQGMTGDSPVWNSVAESGDKTGSDTEMKQEVSIDSNNAINPDNKDVPAAESIPEDQTQPDDIIAVNDAKETVFADADTLDDEFQRMQEANLQTYQEAEAARKQNAEKKVWGIAIAVLVIAIFAVGITTTLRGNKGKKREQ